jgi:hypothetical protein
VRDQAPPEKVERALACLVVLADDEQLLTRGSIVAAGDIAQSAITDIKAIDNGEAKGS